MSSKNKKKPSKKSVSKTLKDKEKQETLIILNNLKGGTDQSKRRALKGFHIPKRLKTSSPSNKTPAIKLGEDKSKTEAHIEAHIDVPVKHRADDDDEPFYEDFKRKRPVRRVESPRKEEYSTVSPHKNNVSGLKNEHETNNIIVKEIHSNIKTKKKDPPLRRSHIISAQPPEISSEEDVEEELRNILEQKLKQKKALNESQGKLVNTTISDTSFNSKRKVVRYTRSSYAKESSLLSSKKLFNVNPQKDSKCQKRDQLPHLRASDILALNTTPDNPPTPPPIHNENDDIYEKHYIDEKAVFSPNTTLSGPDLLNHSFGGPVSERNISNSISANTVESEDKISNQQSQELDSSFVENILKDEVEEKGCDDETPMDWDATDAMGILNELKQCREDLQRNPSNSSIPNSLENVLVNSSRNDPGTKNTTSIYVVIDTNIFIAQLRMVEKLFYKYLKASELYGFDLKVYLPWAVLEELDKLKLAGSRAYNPNMELELNARKAIAFLHEKLLSKSKMLAGQTQAEEQEAEIYKAHNADDRILRTCLLIKAEGKCVLLYTNDRNLANKTIISGIYAYDSTRIMKGIDETMKESKLSSKFDTSKPQSSDSKTMDADHTLTNKNVLNETLMPESEGEEDMIIDSDDHFLQEAKSCRVSTVLDLFQLFEEVWYIIYKYACRYAISLGVKLGNLPRPEISELPPHLVPKENIKHLNQLLNGVIQLAKSLNEFMKISPTSLAVNCRELINFHGCLTLFLVKLDQFKPLGHPSSPDHPPIRPSIMLNFALQPNYREKLNRGLNQLVELRTILHCCKDKVS